MVFNAHNRGKSTRILRERLWTILVAGNQGPRNQSFYPRNKFPSWNALGYLVRSLLQTRFVFLLPPILLLQIHQGFRMQGSEFRIQVLILLPPLSKL